MIRKMLFFSKETVQADKYDNFVFRDALKMSKELSQLPQLLEIPTGDTLHKDVFMSFYKMNPKFLPDDEIYPAYRFNKTILEKAMKTKEFSQLKQATTLDSIKSTIATIAFTKSVIKAIIEKQPELSRVLNYLKNVNHFDEKQVSKASKTVQNLAKNIPLSIIKQSLKQSLETINALDNLGWSSEASSMTKVPPQERLEIATQLLSSEKFRRLILLVGKFKNVAMSTRRSKIHHHKSVEISGVTVGKNVQNAVLSELAKLGHPLLKFETIAKLANGKLLQYETKPKTELGKGNFIACIDLSGSMSGEKELWAKAVALATAMIARKQKRTFALILFSERVKDVFTFNPKTPPSATDLLKIAETFYGGGTNFEEPLSKAIELSREVKNSDILFITDGECSVSSSFLKEFLDFKKKTDTRLVTVLINTKETESVKRLSDEIVSVEDLQRDVEKVFTTIQTR